MATFMASALLSYYYYLISGEIALSVPILLLAASFYDFKLAQIILLWYQVLKVLLYQLRSKVTIVEKEATMADYAPPHSRKVN